MINKKNILLVSIVLFLFSHSLNSQTKIGLQIGPNFANASTSAKSFAIRGKTNFFGGILAEFKISDMFYIQPEINVIEKGVEFQIGIAGVIGPPFYSPTGLSLGYIDHLFNYCEIPINFLVKFDSKNFTPFVFTGPSFNFLLRAKETYRTGYGGSVFDGSDRVEIFESAITFGGGVEFPLSNKIDLVIMAKYSFGLTNIYGDLIYAKTDGAQYPTSPTLTTYIDEKFTDKGCLLG